MRARTVVVIASRLASRRFPAKAVVTLDGAPLISHVVWRAQRMRTADAVVLAVPSSDVPIYRRLMTPLDVPVYGGSAEDVLARVHDAALAHHAEVIVRITGDCPLIDPVLADAVVEGMEGGAAAYAANIQPYTQWADGLDIEAFSISALTLAHRHATSPYDREHVTTWMRDEGRMRTYYLGSNHDLTACRWSVNEPADLARVARIMAILPRDAQGDVMTDWHSTYAAWEQVWAAGDAPFRPPPVAP